MSMFEKQTLLCFRLSRNNLNGKLLYRVLDRVSGSAAASKPLRVSDLKFALSLYRLVFTEHAIFSLN